MKPLSYKISGSDIVITQQWDGLRGVGPICWKGYLCLESWDVPGFATHLRPGIEIFSLCIRGRCANSINDYTKIRIPGRPEVFETFVSMLDELGRAKIKTCDGLEYLYFQDSLFIQGDTKRLARLDHECGGRHQGFFSDPCVRKGFANLKLHNIARSGFHGLLRNVPKSIQEIFFTQKAVEL